MTDRVELTREERSAAIEALRESSTVGYGYGFGSALDSVVAAVNQVRVGDPVGTIRRGPNGNVLVRVRVFNDYELPIERWVHISTGSGVMSRPDKDHDTDWPVIYSPEVS